MSLLHPTICDLHPLGLKIHELACNLLVSCLADLFGDPGVENGGAQGLNQEGPYILRCYQRRQELQRLDLVQSRAVPADEVESRGEQVDGGFRRRAKVYP